MPAPTFTHSEKPEAESPALSSMQRLLAAARDDSADIRARERRGEKRADAPTPMQTSAGVILSLVPPPPPPSKKGQKSEVGIALQTGAFERGSEAEFADALRVDFEEEYGEIVVDDESFWRFDGRCWRKIDTDKIVSHARAYDGTPIVQPESEDDDKKKKKKPSELEISLRFVRNSIELWMRATAAATREKYAVAEKDSFFHAAPSGINCKSFFLSFRREGVFVEPHAPKHRQRHVIEFDPIINKDGSIDRDAFGKRFRGSLIEHFIKTAFPGEPHGKKKWYVFFETASSGFISFAQAVEFRHLVLLGPRARNGKSQALRMFYDLVPDTARTNIEPQNWTTMSSRVQLEHKLFNVVFDMSPSPIPGGIFKTITGGEPFEGRDLYKSSRNVRCSAVHMFGTNLMPHFQGASGQDTGTARRLAIIPWPSFNVRPIPDLGLRIAQEEGDLLLTIIAEMIRRFVKREFRFVKPAFLRKSSADWRNGSDPILMFLAEHTNHDKAPDDNEEPEQHWTLVTDAYACFAAFCKQNGYAQMNRGTFVERLEQSGIVKHRRSAGVMLPIEVTYALSVFDNPA